MISILGMLFLGWILNIFGFGAFVIKGLAQFGLTIDMTGYYLIFAGAGLLKLIFTNNHQADIDR